jgi:hypothetical protein
MFASRDVKFFCWPKHLLEVCIQSTIDLINRVKKNIKFIYFQIERNTLLNKTLFSLFKLKNAYH